jgi:O-antigen/teichoic acid export membrane protein
MPFIKTILSSFKNIHFQSLLGNGVMSVFGMVTIAILYRALSVKEIGIYVFFMTILGLIDTFRSGFLTNSFIKFYSGTVNDRANEVAGSAWCLAIAITGISIFVNILTFFASSFIENEGMILCLRYFSLISVVTLPSFMANLVVQGDKRFDRLLWLRLINQILFTGIVIFLTFMKKSTLTSIVVTYILTNLIASLAAAVMGWTKIGSIRYFSKATFMDLFHFGKYSVGSSVSSNLFKVTDTFFINFFLGPAALAIYNLGGRLMQIIEIPLLSFAASGMPSLSEHYNKNQKAEMMYVMKKMIGMLSVAIVGLALISMIFAEPIIALIGGEKYIHTAAPNLFRIFMSMAILYPVDRFFALTLDVIHLPKINFYKLLIMLALNLLADYIGISIFKSVYAIAVANIFPILVSIIIAYVPLNRHLNFNFWNIYVVGYKEGILFVKHLYKTLKEETL